MRLCKDFHKKKLQVLLFLSPMIIGILCFSIVPFFSALGFSLFEIRGLREPKFIALLNFQDLFTDELFALSLQNTFKYVFLAVPIGLIVSFFLAVILNNPFRFNGFFRTVFYLPSITPIIASVMIFLVIFNPSTGLVNTVLRAFGITGPGWFTDPRISIYTLVITAQWGAGGAALIFLGGLNNIQISLYEAASMDGASIIQKFRRITLPLMTPTIFMNAIMGIIGGMQVFTQAYVIEKGGGGALNSLLFTVLFIYKAAFQAGRMGYAAAASLVLFVLVVLFSAFLWSSQKFWVFDEQRK